MDGLRPKVGIGVSVNLGHVPWTSSNPALSSTYLPSHPLLVNSSKMDMGIEMNDLPQDLVRCRQGQLQACLAVPQRVPLVVCVGPLEDGSAAGGPSLCESKLVLVRPSEVHPYFQEVNSFTYVIINGLRAPEPSQAAIYSFVEKILRLVRISSPSSVLKSSQIVRPHIVF